MAENEGHRRLPLEVAATRGGQFCVLLLPFPAPQRVRNAMLHMIAEQRERHLVEGCFGSVHLGEDVDAIAIVIAHALDAADLSLDAVQARSQVVLVLCVAY